jgi:hypothetical protein
MKKLLFLLLFVPTLLYSQTDFNLWFEKVIKPQTTLAKRDQRFDIQEFSTAPYTSSNFNFRLPGIIYTRLINNVSAVGTNPTLYIHYNFNGFFL